jgi:hypothetical protein
MKLFHFKRIALLAILILQVSCQTTPFSEGEKEAFSPDESEPRDESETHNDICKDISVPERFTVTPQELDEQGTFTASFSSPCQGDYFFNFLSNLSLEQTRDCKEKSCQGYTLEIIDQDNTSLFKSSALRPFFLALKAGHTYSLLFQRNLQEPVQNQRVFLEISPFIIDSGEESDNFMRKQNKILPLINLTTHPFQRSLSGSRNINPPYGSFIFSVNDPSFIYSTTICSLAEENSIIQEDDKRNFDNNFAIKHSAAPMNRSFSRFLHSSNQENQSVYSCTHFLSSDKGKIELSQYSTSFYIAVSAFAKNDIPRDPEFQRDEKDISSKDLTQSCLDLRTQKWESININHGQIKSFSFQICETGDYFFNPSHSSLYQEDNKGCRKNDNYECPEYKFTLKGNSEGKTISPNFTPSLLHLEAGTSYTLLIERNDPYLVDERLLTFSLSKSPLSDPKGQLVFFQDFVDLQEKQEVLVSKEQSLNLNLANFHTLQFPEAEQTLKMSLAEDSDLYSVTLCLDLSYQAKEDEPFMQTLDQNFIFTIDQDLRRQSSVAFQIENSKNENFTCQTFYYPGGRTIHLTPKFNKETFYKNRLYLHAEAIQSPFFRKEEQLECLATSHIKFLNQELAPGETKKFDFTPCLSGFHFIDIISSHSENLKVGLYQGIFPLEEREDSSSFFSNLLEKRTYSLEIENTSLETLSTFDVVFKPSALYHSFHSIFSFQHYLEMFQLNQIPLDPVYGIDETLKVIHQTNSLSLPKTAQFQLRSEKRYSVTACLTQQYFKNDKRPASEVILDYFHMKVDGDIENERMFDTTFFANPCYQFVIKNSAAFLLQPTLGVLGVVPLVDNNSLLSEQENALTYHLYLSITEL